MIIRKAFKFRLKMNPALEEKFITYAGHCRFVWNQFLKINSQRLNDWHSIMRYHEMDFWSKIWKKSDKYGFLSECPAHIIQQKLKDLDKAYRDGFDKNQPHKRLPTWRKKMCHDSFRFPEPKQFEIVGKRIKLPKIGWVRFFKSLAITGTVKNLTISRQGEHWFVAIQVEQEIAEPHLIGTSSIGIDLGIAKFATFSNREGIEPINIFRKLEMKLAQAQRKLMNKIKFSKNWKMQLVKIRKLHRKIADVRLNFLHWWTSQLSKNHAMIVIEDLKVKNMSKSARGSVEEPGKNVRAKSGLNKSILDQGWGEFRRQLTYKLDWKGGMLIAVSPKNTSLCCSRCQHVAKENRVNQADFCCVNCGYQDNADINAAINILAAGHAVMACGASA